MECLTAREKGCSWWGTDPENPEMVSAVVKYTEKNLDDEEQAIKSGRTVQADKLKVKVDRASAICEQVIASAPEDILPEQTASLLARIQARQNRLRSELN